MDGIVELVLGDITGQDTDAIVNAANPSLMGGGGVDGAIHRAAGAELLEACKEIVAEQGHCPTGQAVITPGFNLKGRYVIHTVGPVWKGGSKGEARLLGSAYRNSLLLAEQNNIKTIAFPSISTGAYGFPVGVAAEVAVVAVRDFLQDHHWVDLVRFVLFSEKDLDAYQEARDLLFLD